MLPQASSLRWILLKHWLRADQGIWGANLNMPRSRLKSTLARIEESGQNPKPWIMGISVASMVALMVGMAAKSKRSESDKYGSSDKQLTVAADEETPPNSSLSQLSKALEAKLAKQTSEPPRDKTDGRNEELAAFQEELRRVRSNAVSSEPKLDTRQKQLKASLEQQTLSEHETQVELRAQLHEKSEELAALEAKRQELESELRQESRKKLEESKAAAAFKKEAAELRQQLRKAAEYSISEFNLQNETIKSLRSQLASREESRADESSIGGKASTDGSRTPTGLLIAPPPLRKVGGGATS